MTFAFSATTTFTWDVNGGLPVVLRDGNGDYVYGAGPGGSGGRTMVRELRPLWAAITLADGLGSTLAMVDSAGVVQKSYAYDVYGKPAATGGLANEFDFAGQQTDGTGLQYLGARYIDPETGTFTSREPMSVSPGWLGNPSGYGAGNPARMVDPTGLRPTDGSDENFSCSLGCWLWAPGSRVGFVLDDTGWWVEFKWLGDEITNLYRACRLVGEYKRCTDTDEATAKAWANDTSDAKIRAIVDKVTDVVLVLLGIRGISTSRANCIGQEAGLGNAELFKEAIVGAAGGGFDIHVDDKAVDGARKVFLKAKGRGGATIDTGYSTRC
jgi:RHS repeat-associated protein